MLFLLTALVLTLSLVLGGATRSGFLADFILQVASLPLIFVVLCRALAPRGDARLRLALLLSLVVLAIPLIQIVPLPLSASMADWSGSELRAVAEQIWKLVGHETEWRTISLDPRATLLGALSLLPALAVFCGAAGLDNERRRILLFVFLFVGLISVLLGIVQVAQGPQSALRPFEYTNNQDAVGFFANRNHYAALVYVMIVLAGGWMVGYVIATGPDDGSQSIVTSNSAVLGAGLIALFVLACVVLLARSRAGVGLAGLAFAFIALMAFGDRRLRDVLSPLAGVIAIGVVLLLVVGQGLLFRFVDRFESVGLYDLRAQYARGAMEIAADNMPFGTGVGTFVRVYSVYEDVEGAGYSFANRVHNDWAEWWLETGMLGAGLALILLLLFFSRMWWLWRGSDDRHAIDLNIERASGAAIVLLALHSLADYPLRTNAMLAVVMMTGAFALFPRSHLATAVARRSNATGAESRRDRSSRSGRGKRTSTPRPEPSIGPAPGSPSPAYAWPETSSPTPPPRPASMDHSTVERNSPPGSADWSDAHDAWSRAEQRGTRKSRAQDSQDQGAKPREGLSRLAPRSVRQRNAAQFGTDRQAAAGLGSGVWPQSWTTSEEKNQRSREAWDRSVEINHR